MEDFKILLLGIPTWYYGELQCDWSESLPMLKNINFNKKIIGLFGCGDQEDYSEYFCDALGIMYNFFKKKHANFIGKWPIHEYHFESSKAQANKTHFFGLPIDEDRQSNLTNTRVAQWVKLILSEINLKNIIRYSLFSYIFLKKLNTTY
ncbi:flavodoxin [Buchnera aphidicola (Cinara tujafilina)]|uniref:Flavodoxin n=1 Tax=Buchnera aphidicola (Cinara tujafilina) TaxID=261317 RepID=F7WZU4_9GAMM|nr:flavodoxin [Buchnera aphidicola (Cinara tujafilina)]